MSLIKDFNDLHFSVKGTILTLCSTIPIFFVSVYLFKYDLIVSIHGNPWSSLQFYFLLCLCLTLATLWFLTNMVLSIHMRKYVELRLRKEHEMSMSNVEKVITQFRRRNRRNTEHNERSFKTTFMITYGYATVYLGLCIFLNQRFFHWSFPDFLLGSWSFLAFRIVYVGIRKEILQEEMMIKYKTGRISKNTQSVAIDEHEK